MNDKQEPSMEDILASIRRILSDEDEVPADPVEEPAAEPEEMVAEEIPAEDPVEEMAAAPEEDAFFAPAEEEPPAEENIMELSESDMIIEEKPAPAPIKRNLVAEPVATASACKLALFAEAMAKEKMAQIGNGSITLEQIVKEVLKPFLKEWLDNNLPAMVEKMVQKEIDKVANKIDIF